MCHREDWFLPEKFKLGQPTPGAENDCSRPHFILGDHLIEAVPPVISNQDYPSEEIQDETTEAESQCSSNIDRIDYQRATINSNCK